MTKSEIKKKVAESKNIEWHKGIEETFNFTYVDYVQTLTGITAIFEFVDQQIKGWEQ